MSFAVVVARTLVQGLINEVYGKPFTHLKLWAFCETFLKTLNKIFTENKCDQLLKRLLELENKTQSQKEIILKNIDENKKINELLEEKQIQLEALLLIFAATVVVAVMLLKIILVFNL